MSDHAGMADDPDWQPGDWIVVELPDGRRIRCRIVNITEDGTIQASRPHGMPTRTPERLERQIIELRREQRRGPDWIGAELGVAARTVSRILRRHRLPCLRELDPLTGAVIRASKSTAVRYERDRPGELVHMDVKKIGRIPDGGGWRAHGRAGRERSRDRSVFSGSTTSTPWSMTTPGWPTPRSWPTRKAPPAPDSSPGPPTTSPHTGSTGSSGS